jgi:hypothetical protein
VCGDEILRIDVDRYVRPSNAFRNFTCERVQAALSLRSLSAGG